MERITITVPWTPPRELRPNVGVHWSTRNRARKAGRDDVITAVRQWRNAHGLFGDDVLFTEKVRVIAVVYWGKRRQFWDPDNLGAAIKGPCDGLTQSRVFQDDGPAYIEWAPLVQGKDPAGIGYTELTIEAIAAGRSAGEGTS